MTHGSDTHPIDRVALDEALTAAGICTDRLRDDDPATRCTLPAGHVGMHRGHGRRWVLDEPDEPETTPGTPSAKRGSERP